MLPQALYGDVSWQDTLESTLAEPSTKALSGGRTADEVFFVAAIVGAAGLWMEERESVRERDIVNAIEKSAVAFREMFDTKIRYSIASETEVLVIIARLCPKKCGMPSKRSRRMLPTSRVLPNCSASRLRRPSGNGVTMKG